MKSKLAIFLFLYNVINVFAQQDSVIIAQSFQDHLNLEFSQEETSPLTREDFHNFKSLEFFKIDSSYIVAANFRRTATSTPFVMPTTTERRPLYLKYGELEFTLKGQPYKLNVYQSQRLLANPEFRDYLFIPFTDLTNGESTYGGGRYLDMKIPNSSSLVLDFNQAYNPYCAYNGTYSCPIPPKENDLDVKIEAGVKSYTSPKGEVISTKKLP